MKRDFELEYKELKQNETPDLWNRIEAGLSEKKIAAAPFENERFTVKKQTQWKRLGLLAAACLCVVILLPAVMAGLISFSKGGSSGTDSAASTESADSLTGAAAASDSGVAFDYALEEAAPEEVMPELTDGQILEGVIVQILQADETGEETIYQAVVLEADTDAVLEEGIQIELLCNDETQYDFIREPREEKGLEKEETYEVSLQYEQERFTVLKAAKKN